MLTRSLDCAECDRLWLEYEEATKAFLKVVGDLRIATLQQDSVSMGRISLSVKAADQRRDSAREVILAHKPFHSDTNVG